MSDKIIIYPTDDNKLAIISPNPNCGLTLEEIAKKDVPEGKPFKIIDRSSLPKETQFRDAWEYEE